MKLSPEVAETIAAYEHESGRKVTEKVMQIAEHTYQLGIKLAGIGRRHAMEGRSPTQESEISTLLPVSLREDIAPLLYEQYMYGYNAGIVVHDEENLK